MRTRVSQSMGVFVRLLVRADGRPKLTTVDITNFFFFRREARSRFLAIRLGILRGGGGAGGCGWCGRCARCGNTCALSCTRALARLYLARASVQPRASSMHPRPWGKRTHKFEKAIKYCWLVLKDHPDVLTFVDRTHSEQEESGVTKKSEGPPTVNPRPRSGSLSGEDLSSAMGVSSKADDQLAAAASRQAAADEQNAAAQESKANAAHAQVLWSQYHLLNKSVDNLETVLDIGRQIRALQGVTIRELSEHEGQKRERKAKRKAEKAKRKAAKKAKKAVAAAAAAEAEKAAREAAAAPQREEEGGAVEAARSSEEAAGEDTHVE